MKTCENCIHYELCSEYYYVGDLCGGFKDSSRFVELSCSLGDTAYMIFPGDFESDYMPYIVEGKIYGISQILICGGASSEWVVTVNANKQPFSNLGRTWFLDRAAAEERLEKIIHGN